MPDRPPKEWFDQKSEEMQKGLKASHPDWTDQACHDRAQRVMGDVWYNKMTPQEKQKVSKQFESESLERKAYDEFDTLMDGLEQEDQNLDLETDMALGLARADATPTVPPNVEETSREVALSDGLDRMQANDVNPDDKDAPHEKLEKKIMASASKFVSVPMYKFTYTAAPRPGFEGKDGPILIKALVLEEGENVNGWRVDPREFQSVADQYKAGRHLRINHSKNMEDIIGKSYDGKVIKGVDVPLFLGLENAPEGITPDGMYVAAEFEANPREQQVRTNILHAYCETGSIGLDANAFCAECNKPVKSDEEGKMEKTCRHIDATVNLRDVDVKEYSYVAEPAFEHTKAYPNFSAAVNSMFKSKESSLSQSKPTDKSIMSTVVEPTKEAKVEATAAVATAKKGDSDSESEADARAQAYADAVLKAYKQGMADNQKYRADSESEGESKKKADASVQASAKVVTDQVGVSAQTETKVASKNSNIMEAVMHPTTYQLRDPMIREIFKAAVDAVDAPTSVRRFRDKRWE